VEREKNKEEEGGYKVVHPGDETFFYDQPTLVFSFPSCSRSLSLTHRGGDQDKTMIDLKNAEPSNREKYKKKKKGNFFFFFSSAPRGRCTVRAARYLNFFHSLCECMSVSESPCRTFWDIEKL
jgi:hypothetical protein